MSHQKLSRRKFIKNSALDLTGLSLAPGLFTYVKGNRNNTKPNVVVFYSDDHNFEHIGCYGGKSLTPNLDRLSSEGVIFTEYYVSSSVCTASRYSMLTGRYAERNERLRELYPPDQPAFI